MIESIMFFAGGFLVAALLALVLISSVHHRAVRLTLRRLEDTLPVSIAEIQADRDSLRAEFAMSSRRLEMSVEQLKAKSATQLGEIARKTEAITRLKAELVDKTAVTDALEANAKTLSSKLRDAEQESEVKTADVEANERALAIKEAELAKAASDLNEQRLAADGQRVEMAVLKTQVEQFGARIGGLEQEAQVAARLLSEERVAVSTITKELEENRQAVDTLRAEVARLEGEIASHTDELKSRARLIADLESRNGDQARLLAERSAAADELRQQRDAEFQALGQQRESEVESLGQQHYSEVESLRHQHESDVAALRAQSLSEVEALRAQHEAKVTALQQQHQSEITAQHQQHEAEVDALGQQHQSEVATLRQEIAAERAEHSSHAGRLQEDNSALERRLADANDSIASHAGRIDDFEKLLAERDRIISQRDGEAKALENAIVLAKRESDAAIEHLQADKHSIGRLLQTANQTLEIRAGRIGDLESWVAEGEELLRRRDAEIKALHGEIAVFKDRDEAAAAAVGPAAETAKLEALLQTAIEDRRQAQLELAALKHEAEATWKTERAENALLRERISDIAARVAHMAIAKDKAGGDPIEAILAQSTRAEALEAPTEAIDRANASANSEERAPPVGELITRIRKLQSAASEAPGPGRAGRRKRSAGAAPDADEPTPGHSSRQHSIAAKD
jgi:chromosome segregation ATPase